jgi:hypothetical protein
MAIFAVMGLGDTNALERNIKENFPDDYYAIDADKWFVVANGVTTAKVAEKLGMTGTQNILGVVVGIAGYNGLASSDMWEWLRAKGTKASA